MCGYYGRLEGGIYKMRLFFSFLMITGLRGGWIKGGSRRRILGSNSQAAASHLKGENFYLSCQSRKKELCHFVTIEVNILYYYIYL